MRRQPFLIDLYRVYEDNTNFKNNENKNFWIAFHDKAEDYYLPMVKMLLIDFEINPDIPDFNKRTALMMAAKFNHKRIVALLLERGADPNSLDADKRTPLMYAIRSELYIVLLLLDYGARVDIKDKDEMTALDLAKQEGDDRIIYFLEERANSAKKFKSG